jgi:hypothetical protein
MCDASLVSGQISPNQDVLVIVYDDSDTYASVSHTFMNAESGDVNENKIQGMNRCRVIL